MPFTKVMCLMDNVGKEVEARKVNVVKLNFVAPFGVAKLL